MKAGVLVQNGVIVYQDVVNPDIGSDMVLVKVKASGICGSDIPRVFAGKASKYPLILGHEFSGEVSAIGSHVKNVRMNDKVVAAPLLPCMQCEACLKGDYALCSNYSFIGSRIDGAFAEYIAVPERNIVRLADNADFVHSVFFEPSTVALHALLHTHFGKGASLAVLGCGTIGIFVIQWAKILGAGMIAAFDISSDKLRLASAFGADYTINPISEDPAAISGKLTDKRGFDFVIEAAGSTQTMRLSFLLAGNKATICYIGTPKTELTFSPELFENMNRKEFTLTGSWMSYSKPFPGQEWEMTRDHLGKGDLKISEAFIHKRYPLSRISEAFSEFLEPNKVQGKIILINDR